MTQERSRLPLAEAASVRGDRRVPTDGRGRPAGCLIRGYHGYAGLALVAVCWPLNWVLPGLRTHVLFFPLWLGYILVMDALVLRRTGTSLLVRCRRAFLRLFLVSAPAWWLFEALNCRTQNWQYLGREHFSDVTYFLLASLSFSTVLPAVLETAEWVRSASWIDRFKAGRCLPPGKRTLFTLFAAGAVMLALLLAWPRYFYPFVWGSVYCLTEPVVAWLRRPTLLTPLSRGDWRPLVALSVGALLCGFVWECWNYLAYPKWIYHTPGAEWLYVFEMPLAGYLGYIPFAWELHALLHLVTRDAPDLRLG